MTAHAAHRHPVAPGAHTDAAAGDARTRILDAAASLFAQSGFDGASTARIARAAAVPKGLLFYYFPTKPDILAVLLDERLGAVPDDGHLAVPGDPVQSLMNIGENVLRAHADSAVLREVVWHEAHTRSHAQRVLTRYRHALHDAIVRVLTVSMSVPVAADAVRAAAAAWAAIITARPLTASGEGDADDDAPTQPRPPEDVPAQLHAPESLRAIATLLVAGLTAAAPA